MDIGIIAGIAMLVVWAIGTFVFMAPGSIHLLLTVGVFVVIWRIVVRGTRTSGPGGGPPRDAPPPARDGSGVAGGR